MPNKPIDMYKIRQLIRLYADGRGSKFISSTTGIARNTVKKYLVQFVSLGLSLQDIEKMTDGQLASIFLPEKPVEVIPRVVQLEKMLPELVVMLRRRGITKSMVYEHYAKCCPAGFKHAAFGERLNAYIGMTKPSMRVPHKVGDKLFIDFTGKKLQIVDKQTGETTDVEVFVAILGCSQQTFVMAVASQKKEDFIFACECALLFFDGVPEAIVPDNLKSAVNKASRYEAELNDSFAAFAEHYNTYVFPTRAYKPKDKALVEGAVKIIYSTIFSKIDERDYSSLEELNKDILIHLEVHNDTLLTGCNYSRRQQFEELEKDVLRPLNKYRFDPMTTKNATVGKTGFVTIDHHYYSVPYKFIGQKVKVMYNRTKVEAYHAYEIIAVHARSYGREKYIQLDEHLASWHRYPSEWNPEKFISEALLIDESVAAYIKKYWPGTNIRKRITGLARVF